MSFLASPDLLRRMLVIDAVTSGGFAIALIAAAEPLSDLLGLPVALLRWVGVAIMPFVLMVGWAGLRGAAPAGIVRVIVIANAAWVVASVGLLLSGWVTPTALGTAFVVAQAILVGLYAELQFIGLRRSSAFAA